MTLSDRVVSGSSSEVDASAAATSGASEAGHVGALLRAWAVWKPVALRVVSAGITLVGLAGIGIAAQRSAHLEGTISEVPKASSDLARGGLWLRPSTPAPAKTSTQSARAGQPSAAAPIPAAASTPVPAPTPAAASRAAPCPPAKAKARASGAAAQPALAPEPSPDSDSPPRWEVDINRAEIAELVRLPGVGRKRAQAIVELRERMGGFRRDVDLLRIRGIGARTLRKMRPFLVVGPSPAAAPGPRKQ